VQNVLTNLSLKHTIKNIVQMSVAGLQQIKELWKSTIKKGLGFVEKKDCAVVGPS
jgi:hypothetical protein